MRLLGEGGSRGYWCVFYNLSYLTHPDFLVVHPVLHKGGYDIN
jgi:hypothetical protein